MILRKPYAFLIKHFKHIHLILTACMVYLIFRTEMMISFLNEYINSFTSVIGQPIVASLYNTWVVLLPALILILSIILLVTMKIKDKPRLYYTLMIVVHVILVAAYFYGYTVFDKLQKTIVDLRTISALRDILYYCIILQGVFAIATLIRGVGFDVKKFDFGSDLDMLELSDEDNEEFELDIDFDISDKKRKWKRTLRFLKYKYKEHKFIAHIGMGVIAAALLFYIYSNFNIYGKVSAEGTNFSMNGFTMGVSKSYVLNQNSFGSYIGDGSKFLVVVELKVKNNSVTPASIATGNIELNIGGINYHHVEQYDSALLDLGVVYKGQELKQEFMHYLLVYEIPANRVKSKLKLGFHNNFSGEIAYVRLNPKNMNEEETSTEEYTVGDTLNFEKTPLGNTTLKINSFDIKNQFENRYRKCTNRTKTCVDSVEYLMPAKYNSNYDKALLKLDMDFNLNEKFRSDSISSVYDLMNAFMKIEYELDGYRKIQSFYLGEVKSKRANKNTYYIEVLKEIKDAEKITLVFQIRNNTYRYYLR